MSYRTLKNMNEIISSHYVRVLKEAKTTTKPCCNCQRSKKTNCPLPGQCHTDRHGKVESVVYRAKIVREDNGATEFFYTGLTGGTFKERWHGHMNST